MITYVGSTWHTTMEIGGMVEKPQEIQYPLVSIHHVQLKVDTMPLYKPNFLISNEMWVIWLSQGTAGRLLLDAHIFEKLNSDDPSSHLSTNVRSFH